jgi:hypothetical protein
MKSLFRSVSYDVRSYIQDKWWDFTHWCYSDWFDALYNKRLHETKFQQSLQKHKARIQWLENRNATVEEIHAELLMKYERMRKRLDETK